MESSISKIVFKILWNKFLGIIGRVRRLMICFYMLCATIIIFGFIIALNSPSTTPKYHSNQMYKIFESNDGNYINDSSPVNELLFKQVRVLCWVMTSSDYYIKRGQYIKPTWGKRCNKLLIIGSNHGEFQDNVKVPFNEGRAHLWYKTQFAFNYIYDNHIDDADWFLKVDDDTYVIMENLRYLLYPHDPTVPIYFGCKYNVYVKQGYMSGGAGYVLSKEALRRFVLDMKSNSTLCKHSEGSNEDVKIGKCLERLNVIAGDSRDERGFARFFPLSLISYLTKGEKEIVWYEKYRYHQTEKDCCSEYTISFHYIVPKMMYILDMFLYKVPIYGVINKFPALPKKYPFSYYLNNTTGGNLSQTNKTDDNLTQTKKTDVKLTQTNKVEINFTQINQTDIDLSEIDDMAVSYTQTSYTTINYTQKSLTIEESQTEAAATDFTQVNGAITNEPETNNSTIDSTEEFITFISSTK